MVRITGSLSMDGSSLVLNQGGNSTTLTAGSPSGDITITLPSTSAPILVNPMDSAGDMMYGGASGLITKLDAGTANYLLQANGAAAPTWSLIVNANVDAAAAITLSKLAALTASRALVSDGSGVVSVASTTATQIGYLSSATGTTGTTSTNVVFSTSPTLVTPVLGAASATTINKVAITEPASGSTLTISDGKTLTASNTLTLTGTDASSVAFGAGGTVAYTANNLSAFASTTSAQLAGVMSDETGSGSLVFANTPTLITPVLGVATATSINKVAITAPATGSTLTIADGKTLTASNTLTLSGTDSSSVAFGAGGTVTYTTNKLSDFAATTSAELKTVISDETGSGALVFGTSPTIASPTITGAALGNTNSLTLTDTNFILQGDTGSTRQGRFNVDAVTAGQTRTWSFPDTDMDVLGAASTQTVTNKDINGGTASDTSRITIPKANSSTLLGLTRKQGTILYDTSLNQLVSDDGTSLNAIGSAAGEKNYISSGTISATGWTASGAGVTVATSTTAAELPRENTSRTGIKITGVSGSTAYAYYRFTLDDVDLNRKLKIKFDLKPVSGYVASDMKVDMYSNTASNYGGTSTRIVTSSDSSSIAAIPNMTGQYQTTVDMPDSTAPYMELRIGLNATSTQAIVISDVVVGPGIQPQGAVVTEWISYTPDIGNFPDSAQTTKWRRVGDTMEVWGISTATGAVSGNITLPLPTGYSIDTTKNIGTTASSQAIYGIAEAQDTGTGYFQGMITYESTTQVKILSAAAGDYWRATVPMTWANTDVLSFQFKVPIAEWSGSGTVNVAQNDVEYAYNTSGTTSAGGSDTTSFGYGPAGALTGSIASSTTTASNTSMRVRFQTPISATDVITLEFTDSTQSSDWFTVGSYGQVIQNTAQGTARYGASIIPVSGSATDVDVIFGNAGSRTTNTTYAAAGEAWSAQTRSWRVKKAKGGAAVGFGNVAQNTSGLVKSAGQLLGTNTNDSAATGYVGEILTASRAQSSAVSITSGVQTNVLASPLSLTAGCWKVWASVCYIPAGTTAVTQLTAATSLTSATLPSISTMGLGAGGEARNQISLGGAVPGAVDTGILTSPHIVNLSATTSLYLVGYTFFTISTMTVYGHIQAERIR